MIKVIKNILKNRPCDELEGYEYRKCHALSIRDTIPFILLLLSILFITGYFFDRSEFLKFFDSKESTVLTILIFGGPIPFFVIWYYVMSKLDYNEGSYILGFVITLIITPLLLIIIAFHEFLFETITFTF